MTISIVFFALFSF